MLYTHACVYVYIYICIYIYIYISYTYIYIYVYAHRVQQDVLEADRGEEPPVREM